MAVLPASKAYPRAGMPRREYVRGAPLFATTLVKFNGVEYPRGAELPIADMTPHKHWELWHSGKATHIGRKPVAPPAPAVPVEASAEAAIAAPTLPFDGFTPAPPVDVETPTEQRSRKKR